MTESCHDASATALRDKPRVTPRTDAVIALVGRPNSGKSSVYNALTGGHAHVGNYPGVTVDILESDVTLPSGSRATIADLPGLYSIEATFDPATDEGVARMFLDQIEEREAPLVLVQVIDPTRLALGLKLTTELVRRNVPLLIVLTHADVMRAEGHEVDTATLSDALGAPVVLVDARGPSTRDAILAAIDDCLREGLARDVATTFKPERLSRDVVRDVGERSERQRRGLTQAVDRVLLHGFVGPALFVSIMALLFAAVFLIADPATTLMDGLVGVARSALSKSLGKGLFSSFLADGVLGGAGTVLAFMPQIVILTVALELLEASGYLARGAFLVDRLLRVLGLSGRSFLPLLMGHACAVPAISATRIIRDPRERLTTILVVPLMTCSARLPTYGLVLAAFFAHRSALFRSAIFVALYFAGILAGLAASLVLRRTATRGKSLPLVLEMPSYRLPQLRVVVRKAIFASRRFLREVGTVIVAVSAVLWVLLVVPMPGTHAPEGVERSIAATIGKSLEPITKPAGFDWRINVGLIGSFGAREVMVGTMGVIFGVENAADDPAPLTTRLREARTEAGEPLYSTRTGLSLLAFFVLACQCMSTVAAIRRETGGMKWAAFVVAYTYVLGYAAAVFVYQASSLFAIR